MSDRYNRTLYLYDDQIGRVSYVDHMGSDLTVVNSARVSFGNTRDELNDRDKRLVKYLVKHKHTSTFEHNVITFKFVVPLFIRSQHHRHRTWSYNEISRRYTDSDLQFYVPNDYRTQHKSNRQASNIEEKINPPMSVYGIDLESRLCNEAIEHHVNMSLALFDDMIKKGVAREQARMILPQNLYTEYYATANLSNILKFIELRTHDGAQWEIQQLANKMGKIIAGIWPITMESYQETRNITFDF